MFCHRSIVHFIIPQSFSKSISSITINYWAFLYIGHIPVNLPELWIDNDDSFYHNGTCFCPGGGNKGGIHTINIYIGSSIQEGVSDNAMPRPRSSRVKFLITGWFAFWHEAIQRNQKFAWIQRLLFFQKYINLRLGWLIPRAFACPMCINITVF